MSDDTKKYLHYSPIDVWMFNAAPICNIGKYGDITTTRESVTCPDCNRILDALDVPAPVVDMFAPELSVVVIGTCSCTPCRECKGTGSVFISFDGQYIGSHRWDDMDEMITCEECYGSGIETTCDYCIELEEAEAE